MKASFEFRDDDLRQPVGKIPERYAVISPFANGHKIHTSTAYRQCTRGVVVNGVRIKLPTTRVGSRLYTCDRAIRWFIDRLTNPDVPADRPTQNQIQEQHEAAERELAAAGI